MMLRVWAALLGLLFSVDASASLLSWFGKAAVRTADIATDAGAVLARSGRSGALATVDAAGTLRLTKYGAGATTAIAISSTDDLLRLFDELGTALQVTPKALQAHDSLFRSLLKERPNSVSVIAEDLTTTPVRLATRAQREVLVVAMGEHLTFSLNAWTRRALLDQRIMESLAARMKVIALVPRTDGVLRGAFTRKLGDAAIFVETPEQLLRATRKNSNRLVVVAGHVERDNLVLRGPRNEILMSQSIESVHEAIDSSGSIGLLLGCNSACSAALTGPTTVIDAFDLAASLNGAASGATPLKFLETIASRTGPMHVDTDFYGRLRAVSGAHVSGVERVAATAAVPVRIRILFAGNVSRYVSPGEIVLGALRRVAAALFALVQLWVLGWGVLVIMGVLPKRGWKLAQEHWAAVLEREDHQIEQISGFERVCLVVIGPWLVLLSHFAAVVPHRLFDGLLKVVALLLYPAIRWVAPETLDVAHALAPEGDTKAQPGFRDGREIALLTLFLWALLEIAADAVVPTAMESATDAWLLLARFVLASMLALLIAQRWVVVLAPLSVVRQLIMIVYIWVLRLPVRAGRLIIKYSREQILRIWKASPISTR